MNIIIQFLILAFLLSFFFVWMRVYNPIFIIIYVLIGILFFLSIFSILNGFNITFYIMILVIMFLFYIRKSFKRYNIYKIVKKTKFQDGIENVRYEVKQLVSILGRKFYFRLDRIDTDLHIDDTNYEVIKRTIEEYKNDHNFEYINKNTVEVCDIIFKENDELIKLFNDYKIPHKDLLTKGD